MAAPLRESQVKFTDPEPVYNFSEGVNFPGTASDEDKEAVSVALLVCYRKSVARNVIS